MAALLALISALAYGASDFSGGVASRRASAVSVVVVSNGTSLVLATLAAVVLPGSSVVGSDLAWGAVAGTVGLAGVVLLYRGLAVGPMSVVAPLTAVLAALVPVAVGTARGERPGPLGLTGVVLAVAAIWFVSRPGPAPAGAAARLRVTPAAVGLALTAGLSFGGFYVLLAQTGPDGGCWPLVGQRTASMAVLLLVMGVMGARRGSWLPGPSARPLALVAGVTDLAANLCYLLATHRGLLALVAVLSSLYPAGTVVLARLVLHERLGATQLGGLALAGGAVALIAVR